MVALFFAVRKPREGLQRGIPAQISEFNRVSHLPTM